MRTISTPGTPKMKEDLEKSIFETMIPALGSLKSRVQSSEKNKVELNGLLARANSVYRSLITTEVMGGSSQAAINRRGPSEQEAAVAQIIQIIGLFADAVADKS